VILLFANMEPAIKRKLVFGYFAIIYAGCLLIFCDVTPFWGQWYEFNSYHRLQAEALLHGKLALSHNPRDLAMDLCWSEGGVHQVWGLGVALWQMSFDALARVFGLSVFPDRVALGFFMALSAYVVFATWAGTVRDITAACPRVKRCKFVIGFGAVGLMLALSPLVNFLCNPLDHYNEVLIYVYFFPSCLFVE
jgi:hypothetical protein